MKKKKIKIIDFLLRTRMWGLIRLKATASMAYKIYDSCKSERELYIVSGSEHTDCYRSNPEKYESIVSEFLKKHIPTN